MNLLERLSMSTAVTLSVFFLCVSFSPGCSGVHRGMVEVQEASIGKPDPWLVMPDGRRLRLRLDQDGEPIRALGGCMIEAEGRVVARSMLVEDWQVTDAGDGSAPYVGLLRQHGSNVVIEDRNSGMPLILDDASVAELGPFVGKYMMIVGYVVGAQQLHVVSFRILIE